MAVDKIPTSREVEVEELFERTLPVIRSALVGYYRLSVEEAGEAENDLRVWFTRLARRAGAAQMPVKTLRIALLSAACQYGLSFQIWKLGGSRAQDEALNTILTRTPTDVAGDLAARLDEEFSKT